ncbi:molybdenum cofactor synthesis domain protein [Halovivax ruber XH-70]|uniref:Molybdenum cofactor synthesis domain protein n=1 Tax=Halovivax ruber (strain DSM 18193 / JCM 13892 / XH-70) TaxID=797302 RepID=L0IDG7_HALRX|nr:molybdopterin biosynthesis protein [Halovivax ruber]AGB16789.1 molybdenum cofactor synthesis domain protein [Halovivax ruber XH-70]
MDHTDRTDLSPPSAAREAIRDLARSTGTEHVPLDEASGRVLAERIEAGLDVPGFDRAALDGYALRAADTDGAGEGMDSADENELARLALVGTVRAGERPDVSVGEGEAVEISTGAVLPPGADAMVPVEQTERVSADEPSSSGDEEVRVEPILAAGDNVSPAGSDIAAGQRALGPGTRLTPREIGLLAALGTETVAVRSPPRVGIVSTGDELVPPGDPIDGRRGEIYDVNGVAIAAAVEAAGGDPVRYPHVGDDWEAMEAVLRTAADECDLVLSSGSTSAGALDVVYRLVDELGELLLHGVRIKPGKPMLVGRLDGTGYVGLPGYPVSAMTVFRTFVAPAIRAAAGQPAPRTATVTGRMAVDERFAEDRHRLVPVGLIEPATTTDEDSTDSEILEGHAAASSPPLVYPVDRGSGATTSLARADGVVEMPAATDRLAAGERVTVSLFSPSVRPPSLLVVGEDDPTVSRALDDLENPRYLSDGSRPALRSLAAGVPDVAVVAGPIEDGHDGRELTRFTREWGLLVPAGNPDEVAGVADLVDRDLSFVNRTADSGLRRQFDAELAAFASTPGRDRAAVVSAIDGVDIGLPGHESPARRVARGEADVGLGLRDSAGGDLSFVSLGEQPVRLLANPDRVGKLAIDQLIAAIDRRTGP